MRTRVISKSEMQEVVRIFPVNAVTVPILLGDRLLCCDEAVVTETLQGEVVGICTISRAGEGHDGQPTIVGLYIRKRFRKNGFGQTLFESAVRRCLERGFDRIRVDVLSYGAQAIVAKLPEELRGKLGIHSYPTMCALDDFFVESE